jgi:hypothetical protein
MLVISTKPIRNIRVALSIMGIIRVGRLLKATMVFRHKVTRKVPRRAFKESLVKAIREVSTHSKGDISTRGFRNLNTKVLTKLMAKPITKEAHPRKLTIHIKECHNRSVGSLYL